MTAPYGQNITPTTLKVNMGKKIGRFHFTDAIPLNQAGRSGQKPKGTLTKMADTVRRVADKARFVDYNTLYRK